ncbi:hypothetical protein GC194_04950 [bacterium]|nr:hypothetical protein [bacterium]
MVATLERISALCTKKVTFLTIKMDEHDTNEFSKFLEKHVSLEDYRSQLQEIKSWIKKIGERGAKRPYFKPEQEANALPPCYHEARLKLGQYGLRLYCIRWSETTVILLNGAEKTADKAQNCPNVMPHFRLANNLARQLQNAVRDGEISNNNGILKYDSDFVLEI